MSEFKSIDEAIAHIRRVEKRLDEAHEKIFQLEDDIDEMRFDDESKFDEALAAIRANRIEDALWELERALPDEFIGFAETIIKWKMK